jgi:hypothetical protein
VLSYKSWKFGINWPFRMGFIQHLWFVNFGQDLPTTPTSGAVLGANDPKSHRRKNRTQKALPGIKTRRLSYEPLRSVKWSGLWVYQRTKHGKRDKQNSAWHGVPCREGTPTLIQTNFRMWCCIKPGPGITGAEFCEILFRGYGAMGVYFLAFSFEMRTAYNYFPFRQR